MIPSSGQNGLSRFESFSTRLPCLISGGDRRALASHLVGRLVLAQPEVHRRPQPSVVRPLGELDLGDELRLDPGDVAPCAPAASSAPRRTATSSRSSGCRAARAAGRSRASSKPGADVPRPAQAVRPRGRRGRARRTRPRGGPGPACSRRSRAPGGPAASPSASRASAGPARYGESARFATTPSKPLLAAPPRAAPRRRRTRRDADAALPRVDQLLEPLAPLGQRQVEQRLAVDLEQVEDDETTSCPLPCWSARSARARPRRARRPRRRARRRASAARARARGRPSRKRSVRSLPFRLVQRRVAAARRVTIARKPSHFGSKSQPSPVGSARPRASRASARSRAARVAPRLRPCEEQPVLLVAVEVRRHERPDALEPLAVEPDREAAVPLLLEQLVGAAVPDLDRAGAVLARRDLALEVAVVERVVLDVHGEVPLAGLERHALRHGPARERAVPLEPEVVVEPAGVVALDHEERRARPSRAARRTAPASCRGSRLRS